MQDVTSDARDFLNGFHTTYVNVRDPTDDVSRRWGVTGLPETFFVGRQGRGAATDVGGAHRRRV